MPALVVRPASAAEVASTVAGCEHALALSVKGGGHNLAGRRAYATTIFRVYRSLLRCRA